MKDEELKKRIGENIKRIRKEKKISRKAIAAAIKTTVINFGKYERGISPPPYDKLLAIADFLEVPVAHILEDKYAYYLNNIESVDEGIFKYRITNAIDIATSAGCSVEKLSDGKISLKLPTETTTESNGQISVTFDINFKPIIFDDQNFFLKAIDSAVKSALTNEIFTAEFKKAVLKS